ncbi:hypothetical protein [Olivibacter sp. XZL3]|uniref:hypothetical protein n=1 Tax=Olivibacter sp. XZL3 TaxID=1735116 RepID=UPI0010669C1B|nr:hypothetical protein [Olivibacter sp. XZL3]
MNRILFALNLIILCLWTSCKRADDEPVYPATPISRLYISFSDIANSDTQVYQNAVVVDPADSAGYIPTPTGANTNPQQGMGIFYSPDLQLGFQVSRNDTTIRYFSVSDVGNISTSTRSFKDVFYLYSPRSIRYDNKSDQLFITNDRPDSSSLNIYYNPARLVGQQNPRKRLGLANAPWGIATGMTLNTSDSLLLLSMQGNTKQIWGFALKDFASVQDTFVNSAKPNYTISIETANDLRGISYSSRLDILVLSDLGLAKLTDNPSNSSTDGKIYVIENAKQAIMTGGTITPTRTITGSRTALVDPIDVAITDLPNRNHYIYVIDRAKRLSRFPLDANGNAEPEASGTFSLTPEFMYLDSRGPNE